jgi:hypothetical protein
MPSVGRVVHYVARGSADGVFEATCRAAIVTDVPADGLAAKKIGIAVLNPDGILFAHAIPYSDIGPIDEDGTPNGGTWHWPERV